jgi:hypothetical protein
MRRVGVVLNAEKAVEQWSFKRMSRNVRRFLPDAIVSEPPVAKRRLA